VKTNYDIAIAYRIYPGVSKEPPVFANDKLKLSELCLYTFRQSLGNLRFKIFAILDNCPDIYIKLFKKYFKEDELEIIRMNGVGNAATFQKQIQVLLDQEYSDLIYFAEDDYFYKNLSFIELIDFMNTEKQIDFITPYEHPDYYNMKIHRQFNSESIIKSNRIWNTAATTTLTFLTNKTILKETRKTWESYLRRNSDAGIWLSLTKHKIKNPFLILKYLFSDRLWFRIFTKTWILGFRGIFQGRKYKLWYPNPSIATHMDKMYLAPGLNDQNTFEDIKRKINFVS
jgi:hypothetical protein